MKIAFVFPHSPYPAVQPPLGILTLASYLRIKIPQLKVDIIDANFYSKPEQEIERHFETHHYDLVGISVMSARLRNAIIISTIARNAISKPIIIWGGPHATVLPEQSLIKECVDMVCLGEGEITLQELISKNNNPKSIAGIWYKRDGKIVRNKARMPIEDLSILPQPAFDLVNMETYIRRWYSLSAVSTKLRGNSIIASRGCPFSCSYCQPTLDKIFGKLLRYRPVSHIISELSYLKKNIL